MACLLEVGDLVHQRRHDRKVQVVAAARKEAGPGLNDNALESGLLGVSA